MRKAQLVTIGTEITSGEVVNSNASWISLQLEGHGLRVLAHVTVRDQKDEILEALRASRDADVLIVTGGLGPTSDDITRACMAEFLGLPLEFDEAVWAQMARTYQERGLPLRAAHRHQCHFPRGTRRLANPVGTALGFAGDIEGRPYFVLPGPPRELEGMWFGEVDPALRSWLPPTTFRWRRWTCLGSPESEVAEIVERCIAGSDLEVGYRATVPYVKVKLYADDQNPDQQKRVDAVTEGLKEFLVGEGTSDLAEELLQRWPRPMLAVHDQLCENFLAQRLFAARRRLPSAPTLEFVLSPSAHPPAEGLWLARQGNEFAIELILDAKKTRETRGLSYRVKLDSERGRLSVAEWGLWFAVRQLRGLKSP